MDTIEYGIVVTRFGFMINKNMRLHELFENITQEYLNNPDEIDQKFNSEAFHFADREREFRKKQGTGVIEKPHKEKPTFVNKPEDEALASSGYLGNKEALSREHKSYFSLDQEPSQ